jgi:hypothetical protein
VGQLVVIGLVVILLCAAGLVMQQGNAVQRGLGNLLLGAGGLVTGFVIALLLEYLLWPSVFAILGGTYQPLPPDQARRASILFFAILGGCGAIVPSLAFRLGYAAGALAIVSRSLDYWTSRDEGWVILVGVATWVIVAVIVRTVAWWLRPDPQDEEQDQSPAYWNGTRWVGSGPKRPAR